MNELFLESEFDTDNNKKYKIEAIKNSAVNVKKIKKIFTRPILSKYLKKLLKKRKHLKNLFCSHASSKNDLHIL